MPTSSSPSPAANMRVRVCVIGAGISGLAAAKVAIVDHGVDAPLNHLDASAPTNATVVLESSSMVGGLWQYRDDAYSVMSFTRINVSKYNYCFSDFPVPDDFPDYLSHEQMCQYINRCIEKASHFAIRLIVQFLHALKFISLLHYPIYPFLSLVITVAMLITSVFAKIFYSIRM